MGKVTKYENGSRDWLEARRRFVTGTEVASLFGLNPSQSVAKVIRSKTQPDVIPMNHAMRAGLILESGVFTAMKMDAGIDAKPLEKDRVVMMVDENVRISASLDGVAEIDGCRYVVEAKTMSMKLFQDQWKQTIPIKYYCQIQTQLLLTESDSQLAAGLSYEFPLPLTIFQIFKDTIFHDYIKLEVARFWECLESKQDFKVNKEYKEYVQNNYSNFCQFIY